MSEPTTSVATVPPAVEAPAAAPARESVRLDLPSGKSAFIVADFTGYELRSIESAKFRHMRIDPGERVGNHFVKDPSTKYDVAKANEDEEEAMLRAGVLKFDDSTENIVERILGGSGRDYQAIADALKKLQTPA